MWLQCGLTRRRNGGNDVKVLARGEDLWRRWAASMLAGVHACVHGRGDGRGVREGGRTWRRFISMRGKSACLRSHFMLDSERSRWVSSPLPSQWLPGLEHTSSFRLVWMSSSTPVHGPSSPQHCSRTRSRVYKRR